MPRGKTLWEMLVDWFRGPVELRFYNPLRAKVGAAVLIDTVELRDYQFFLEQIREVRRTIGGREFPFVDYDLRAKPLNADEVVGRLRLMPLDEPNVADTGHDMVLLGLDDEMAYSEALHDVVRDNTRKFEVLEDGEVKEEFWRINDVGDPYRAAVNVLRDADRDGQVESDEVERRRIEYWDYWRDTTDEFGQPLREYLFVEMDADNGWFSLWRGIALDPKKVVLM